MSRNSRLGVWLPVIIAASIALGIFIGNHYLSITQGKRRGYMSGNKINTILDMIDAQYVDTVNMRDLVESTIPKIFADLDPHSVYIPVEEAAAVNEELEGSFSGIGVTFNMQTDTILVISVISGGPAEKAGLLPFDRIITINDSVFSGVKKNQDEIMKTLRDSNNTLPIVVLTTRSGRDDIIRAFELGCDDYITKPFSMDILILRIRAILRRYHAGESKPETVFDINGRMFDSVHQTFDGKHMSSRESDLLLLLCRNLNQLVERHVILSALWKSEDYFSSRSLSVYVNHLRGFLNETGYRIIGVHGKGYKMVDNK